MGLTDLNFFDLVPQSSRLDAHKERKEKLENSTKWNLISLHHRYYKIGPWKRAFDYP